ncbi:hypothetical protein HPB47_014867, partial [Ixodes persulcatus]
MATKWCTENGTWYVSPEHGQPWTNYTRCFPQGATMQSENISIFEPHKLAPEIKKKVWGLHRDGTRDDTMTVLRISSMAADAELAVGAPSVNVVSLPAVKAHRTSVIRAPHVGLSRSTLLLARSVLRRRDFSSGCSWPHLPTIKLISKVCYTVSVVTLLAAFLILASIKRLRCPRNSLHMHLFISFILRALAFLLKDALFVAGVGLSSNVDFNKENVDCKVFTSFWHYVLMANYCWILMEGLYLHSLVFLAFFTDSSGIIRYVALGWGLPVLFIIPWVVVRATLGGHPVNFILFLNITRVLFAKLFASQTPQARKYRYRKWFKSTLVLVPLFGAHYAFLLGMSLAAAGDLVELIWLYVDQLFSSSQGFVVALLYCFLNGE